MTKIFSCSACGRVHESEGTFCPHCGAAKGGGQVPPGGVSAAASSTTSSSSAAGGKGYLLVFAVFVAVLAGIGGVLLLVESGSRSEAETTCRDALETELLPADIVDIEDVEERSSGYLTKVEGSVAYRRDAGAGERVDTWFICQVDENGDLRELQIKE